MHKKFKYGLPLILIIQIILIWLSVKMNIEDYREYCLSLGADVEEKPGMTVSAIHITNHQSTGLASTPILRQMTYCRN